jgi:hypothetical protein
MRRLLLLPLLLLVLPVASAASDGGPSPGTTVGWDGVVSPNGLVRYVALPAGRQTTLAVVRVRGGRVINFLNVPGSFGVPLVTQNGEAGGLSRDGRTLILATFAPPGPTGGATRFAVFHTKRLSLAQIITLRGSYSYDALSPDGKTMYVIEYTQGATSVRYRVRALDLTRGRLLAGAIADKRLWGDYMRGFPVSRATTSDGGWVYTLYGKQDGTAFVHMLDAKNRAAVCVNLPWRHAQSSIGLVKLSLSGTQLVLSQRSLGKLALVDTKSFAVRAFHKPVARVTTG